MKTVDELVKHLIYGDIDEMTFDILGEDCPDPKRIQRLNNEQHTRYACAATVKAWSENRLNSGGWLISRKPEEEY